MEHRTAACINCSRSSDDPTPARQGARPPNFHNRISKPSIKKGNLSFRIPLQTFGLGLIEAIQDMTILSNAASTASLRAPLGIGGMPNRSGNDGTITRFGWKAQNKSVLVFSGEAYNVEMGVTNDVFPTSTDETSDCNHGKNEPNDITRVDTDDLRNQGFNNPLHMLPDWLEFAIFMRQLAPPQPVPFSTSAQRGQRCSVPASTIRESAAFFATRR